MLCEGFRNDIMDEYLAGICARTGKLHEALSANDIDRALLDGPPESSRRCCAVGRRILLTIIPKAQLPYRNTCAM